MPATIHTRDYATDAPDTAAMAALLAPIPGPNPAGEFLRHEGTYDHIAEARREDDERLDQGVWQKEIKRADWSAVAQLCGVALERRTKDLQIAAWLTEAWCRLRGFPGLNDGLRLISALSAAYWNEIYPPLEDIEYRIVPFHWINEKLAWELQFIPLTQPGEAQGRAFCWADWESANRLQQQRLQQGTSEKAGGGAGHALPAQIQQALRLTAPAVVSAHLEQIALAAATAVELESFLDGRIAAAGPSLRQLRARLSEIEQWLSEGADSTVTSLPPAAASSLPGAATAPGAKASDSSLPPSTPVGAGPRSRDEAYRQLAEAAAYLMRTEPHSPTPYLIQRAIRWGSLPLDQLLPELVRNESALGDLQQLLSFKKQKSG